jgi:hypothetical protein
MSDFNTTPFGESESVLTIDVESESVLTHRWIFKDVNKALSNLATAHLT